MKNKIVNCTTYNNFCFLDNQNDFIGCLNPGNPATPLRTEFNSSSMTITMCERFCQGHGHSVALLRQRTQCFCSDYSQVMHLDEARFSCLLPCGGNEKTFCGGKEAYSAYRTMPGKTNKRTFTSLFFMLLCSTDVVATGSFCYSWFTL